MITGKLVFASFRGSPPDLAGPTFPRTGDLIVAELCSWDCDKAMEVLGSEQLIDQQNAILSIRETLEQDLGRILLGAIRGAKDGTSRFIVPVGSEEVHIEMSLKPLNPHVSASDPTVLNLMSQVARAANKVRNSGKRDSFGSSAIEMEAETLMGTMDRRPRPDSETDNGRRRNQVEKVKVGAERIRKEWSCFWRRSYKFLRCRVSHLFFFVVACCTVVTVLIWYFALFDDLQVRILMSLVIAWIPMTDFQPQPRTWASREYLLGLSSLVGLAVLLVAGDKYDWSVVALNSVVLLVALPYGWLVWKIMRRNGLLLTGLILALAAMMILWTAALVRTRIFWRCCSCLCLWCFSSACLDAGGGVGIGHCRTVEEP